MKRNEVTLLPLRLAGESSVASYVIKGTGNLSVVDCDVTLKVTAVLSEEIDGSISYRRRAGTSY